MTKTLSVTPLALFFAGCGVPFVPGGDLETPLVSMQVTETSDPDAFERIISELEARQIRTTILVDGEFAARNCERLASLHGAGFELMAFVRPEGLGDEVVTMSMLEYEEQEELITGVKSAIEDCVGKSITGMRPYRFDQNEDTYAIVDSLGFDFNLGFVANTDRSFPEHENSTLPYLAPGYGFWAVPMHSVYVVDRWVAFCDMPFSRLLDGPEWEAMLVSQFDDMRNQNQPLIVEIHPYYTGVDEGRFEAFVGFLDYATEQNAQFITVAELVEWANREN